MKLNGTTTIKASQVAVWEFVTSPDRVSDCVPGLESMTVLETDKRFQAIASIGFGNIRARFTTEVEWLELDGPKSAKMAAHGTAPGSAVDVVAELHLESIADAATRLDWVADVNIVGTIASLANRMMGSVTEKISGQFFDCIRRQLET